jgi:hypothetical protein
VSAKAAACPGRGVFTFSTIIPCHGGAFAGMLTPNADAFAAEIKGHMSCPQSRCVRCLSRDVAALDVAGLLVIGGKAAICVVK